MMSFGVAGTWLLIPGVLHEVLQFLSNSLVSSLSHQIHHLLKTKCIFKFYLLTTQSGIFNLHDNHTTDKSKHTHFSQHHNPFERVMYFNTTTANFETFKITDKNTSHKHKKKKTEKSITFNKRFRFKYR